MKVLIVGAGGVGGYVGARLLASGVDVRFVVREARRVQLAAGGLVVDSPLGPFTGAVNAVLTPPASFSADVIVIACKAPALESALDVVAAGLGPQRTGPRGRAASPHARHDVSGLSRLVR